jgi:hypothetical protein
MCSPVLTFMVDNALIAIGARAACLLRGPTCGFGRRPFLRRAQTEFTGLSEAVNPSGAAATVQSPSTKLAYRAAEVE